MSEEKPKDIVLEIDNGYIGFDEILERAARRQDEMNKQSKQEEVEDNGETGK